MIPSAAHLGSPAGTGRSRSPRMLATALIAALVLGTFFIAGTPGTARAADPVRVMPLGDSITGSPGCWRQLLWSRLQSSGFSHVDFVGTLNNSTHCGTAYDGDNEGHGGFLATNILSQNQLPGWLSATSPDVVMMQLGTNDVWNNIPASSLLTTFSGLVDQMRANNPRMRIVVAQILPMNPSGCADCAQRVITLNNAIPAWAAGKSTTASPITVADTWTGFTTATDTGDGVHPNDAGNQKLATAWYPALTAAVNSVGGTDPTTPPTTPSSPTPSATPTTSPPVVSNGCTAVFTLGSAWTGGFVGTVKVTNRETSIARWRVGLTIPSGTAITNVWNGQLSGSTVSSAAWNGSLPVGGTAEFGFQATGSPTGLAVASCLVN